MKLTLSLSLIFNNFLKKKDKLKIKNVASATQFVAFCPFEIIVLAFKGDYNY